MPEQFPFTGVLNPLHPNLTFRARSSRGLHDRVSCFQRQGLRFLPVPAALPVLPSANQAEPYERTHVGRRRHHLTSFPSTVRVFRDPYFGRQTTLRISSLPSVAPKFPARRVSDLARHCPYSLRQSISRAGNEHISQEGRFRSSRIAYNARAATLGISIAASRSLFCYNRLK